MKKILLSLSLVFSAFLAVAQQDPQFTMWQFDRLSVNPAFSGIDRMHCITALHRDQWDGLDKDPKTYLFNYSGMYGAKQNIGFGATLYSEVLGQQQNTVLRFSPSYHLPISNGSYFSAGLSIGMFQSKLGANWVFIDYGDPTIPVSEKSQNGADIGLGFSVYKPKKYYFGVSSTHLNAAKLDEVGITLARHYYVMGGYEAAISSDLVLRPNIMFKTDASSNQIDVNADVLFKQMLWGGLAFRPGDAIAPYVGFQKNFEPVAQGSKVMNHGVRLGYSYDVTTSLLKDYSAGSHEIFLTYCLHFTEVPIRARHSNPRFL
jgi:type IX secretion system PorP/SprF family membrane protein